MPIGIFRGRDDAAGIIICHAWQQKLSPNELPTISPFLRFDKVIIWCDIADLPIEEKCEFIENQLLPLKLALYDSNVVEFTPTISQNGRNNFSDHSMLLDFIRNRLLPNCNSSRRYKFKIRFSSDRNSDTNVIASILEMDEIKHCSNVEIGIIDGEQKRLPVEEISNWLERSADEAKNNIQNHMERFLNFYYIYYFTHFIQNARELLEHLAKVF